ncbi:MAG: polysaccharide deacetylase family protein [Patescibacteria group bacterium]|jgi:peptidoglycan/xylan/chitin deacetylase (PgdA/CDA1 family)
MTASKPNAKILALKIAIFLIVAAGLFWLADFYARANNIDSVNPAVSKVSEAVSSGIAKPIIEMATSSSPIASSSLIASSTLKRAAYVHAPILMYHYISAAPATTTLPGLYLDPAIFEGQLQEILKGGYQTVFMSELSRNILSGTAEKEKAIALTFDDGYEDFYTNTFPLLKKYNLKSTFYVIVNALDKPGYVTRVQLQEMAASGFVEIGSHTFNHPDLRLKKEADAIFEIKGSKAELEKIIGRSVLTFAYPYGYYNYQILEITKTAGYLSAVSVIPGSYHKPDNAWLITRLRPGSWSGEEFAGWLKRN